MVKVLEEDSFTGKIQESNKEDYMKPLISCLVPAYNSDQYLAETLQSLLDQTFKDFEIIVINDGSTDTTDELMDYFLKKDKRIRYYKNPKNLGIAKTRNIAFSHARGKYIAICDADDIYDPHRLKKSLRAIEGADIVFSPILNADADGKVFQITEVPKQISLDELRKGNQQIPHPSIMAKRKCFEEHPYDDSFKSNDDLKLIMEWYLAGYTWKRVNMPFVIHRHYLTSTTVARKREVAKYGDEALNYLENELKRR
jgi:teichuronic acid biosynthesis glycosyltransferase TuaG